MKFKTKKRVYELSLAKRLKHIRFNYSKNFRGSWGLNFLGIILKSKVRTNQAYCYARAGAYNWNEIKL
jgi:hypothetical protein